MIQGFKDFVFRGNIVDLAIAVVIGTAFAALVKAFTESFVSPLIALIGGGGPVGMSLEVDGQYFTFGAFITAIITFVLTAAVVYFAIMVPLKALQERRASGEEPEPEVVPEDIALLREIRDALKSR
ncbi:large conductance mechanosensitive channel [Aeromicrobium panaciterrae]|uniref:Large-conductance mechanosensitive channel n=1 Tax=Aeromicrobium panaciterrae TaxID=363861 RepID=A0ABU1ULK7_9ACTN|nr:large conductance mechanosensitive channel protein MscL [Aeromicrobium panaciterrae]MDR7086050.1 large conductance mechanosensitive channel [Aeromicrobium panaciterrae]